MREKQPLLLLLLPAVGLINFIHGNRSYNSRKTDFLDLSGIKLKNECESETDWITAVKGNGVSLTADAQDWVQLVELTMCVVDADLSAALAPMVSLYMVQAMY